MGRRGRRRRRGRGRRPRGFSDPLFRLPYDILFGMAGIRGRRKRHILNWFAWCIAASVAVVAGIVGGIIIGGYIGPVGGVIGGIVVAGVAVQIAAEWMEKDRFYRP